MGLLDRVAAAGRRASRSLDETWPYTGLDLGVWASGAPTYGWSRAQEIERSLPGFSRALRRCPPAFAAQMTRAVVLSQARFTFRGRPSSSTPRRLFGTDALSVLERPWPNGTTGELIARCEWHAGLAGNAFVTNRTPDRLRMMRPDWTMIVHGSESDPQNYPGLALDSQLLGYMYQNGGIGFSGTEPQFLLPEEVAHWAPLPDPEFASVGMSWITPAVREIEGDVAATEHKIQFFRNGATPQMVVKGLTARDPESFKNLVDMMEDSHAGVANAYKTLYLTAGADATVVGADLKQIDFKATQGAGETRISALSRVHPVILGLSEGLEGSSLNAGNFAMARRIWGDTWIFPTLQDLCGSLATLIDVPGGAELWFDTTDMPILREDAKDAASISQTQAQTIGLLVDKGFTRESSTKAVIGQDMSLLEADPNWVSLQLQQSQNAAAAAGGAGGTQPAQPAPALNGKGA